MDLMVTVSAIAPGLSVLATWSSLWDDRRMCRRRQRPAPPHRRLALGVACGVLLFAAGASAQDMSLMFTSKEAWQKLSPDRRTALAADLMRVFCTQQTMQPEALAGCLDNTPDGEPFDRAIGCVKRLQEAAALPAVSGGGGRR